ncbi:MAG: PAS domain S-box protein [Bryobacteraceae bacterium]
MNPPERASLPGELQGGDKKQANQTARSLLQDRFDVLIDCVVDYAFMTLDLESRVTSWNRGAERILGYSEGEILSRSSALFFTPEDQEKGEPGKELAVATRDGRAEDERWHVKKDGSRFWASGVMTLLRDQSGQPLGFVKIFRDLTSSKTAQEALQESENRFRLFVENVRDHALFQVDPSMRISVWNSGAERLFGYSAHEIVGRPFRELFPLEDREAGYPEQELIRTLAEGQMQDARWLLRRDGTRFFAAWVTHPVYDDGQLRGYAKVLRDETETLRAEELRRRQEEQERAHLQKAVETQGAELDRTKEELRALAASLLTAQDEERRHVARELHDDVSQRLAVLEMHVSLLQSQPEMPDALKQQLEGLTNEITKVSEGVRTLSHGLHPSMLEHLGLIPALRSLGSEFEKVQSFTFHLISFPLQRTIPLSVASTLYRIAQEALRNVAKHAPGSLVTVRVTEDEHELHLSIHDNGPGFDPASTATHHGLGLISIEERVRLVGGKLALSAKPGGGTRIDVTVPHRDQL